MNLVSFAQAAAAAVRTVPTLPPHAPNTPQDTGLSTTFLCELVAKTMFQQGVNRLTELSAQLCLPGKVVDAVCQFMRRESLLEIARRGHHEADVTFELTLGGRTRAAEWLARNSYVGPAPVPLDMYTERVQAQSATKHPISSDKVRECFADLVVPEQLLDQLGTAMNSGRPMMLYGPAGSGKTYLAGELQRLLAGPVAVPYAIYVHGEVIRVFDALCHKPVQESARSTKLDDRARADARWVMCQRPVVVSGGELTLEMLDLSFDARAGYYEAPPHFKANNGIFIVDDLGRQVITPRQLMNRWIVPMERRIDYLMLRNGGKFMIPFDLVLVFSSNLTPAQLEDPAFLRRLGHKIEVGPVSLDEYQTIFERACAGERIAFDVRAFDTFIERYHWRTQRPLLACYPRDLLHLIASRARYLSVRAELSAPLLHWAWHTYFGTDAADASGSTPRKP